VKCEVTAPHACQRNRSAV